MEKKEWGFDDASSLVIGGFIGVISFFVLWFWFDQISMNNAPAFALFGSSFIAGLSAMLLIKESERHMIKNNKETYELGYNTGGGAGLFSGFVVMVVYFCLTGWTVFGNFLGLSPSDVYYNGNIDFVLLFVTMLLTFSGVFMTCTFSGIAGGFTGAIVRAIIKY
jgi:hypothetical protein